MADEVYKILQSRLRRNAQHTNCGDQPDCDVHRNTLSEESNSQTRKKTRVAPPGAEVKKSGEILFIGLVQNWILKKNSND